MIFPVIGTGRSPKDFKVFEKKLPAKLYSFYEIVFNPIISFREKQLAGDIKGLL